MEIYVKNRYCPCIRCKMNDSMGPAVLITLGTMLLLDNVTQFVRFPTVIAVLLIVVGAVKLLQSSASTEGHRQPGTLPASAIPPVPPVSSPPTTDPNSENRQVQHG
jgi:hypothetical protein